jgi:hypothetical protein
VGKSVIIYSGGTDSTCVAALKSQLYDELHLLTFFDESNKGVSFQKDNIDRLKAIFPEVCFVDSYISTDEIFRFLSRRGFFKNIWKHKLLVLANCLYSSLSWHIRTIRYCQENDISEVFDGITNEMTHLPNHTNTYLLQLREFYKGFGIQYENPVRDWEVPPKLIHDIKAGSKTKNTKIFQLINRLIKATVGHSHFQFLWKNNSEGD